MPDSPVGEIYQIEGGGTRAARNAPRRCTIHRSAVETEFGRAEWLKTAKYFVAVVGGAISGSVAAEILADRGIRVAVIEQNKRPYGKIEDGLPRWHVEQRKQEYGRIDARLKKPGVYFVPSTKLGRDLEFDDFCHDWGFSAVILANGAWRDRDLGVPGAAEFVDKGLVYQNPFIYWYNHKNEKTYDGPALRNSGRGDGGRRRAGVD